MLTPASQLGINLDFLVQTRTALGYFLVTERQEAAITDAWKRTDRLLAEYADGHPAQIRCFHEGATAHDPRSCQVNLLLSDGLALWLGMALRTDAAYVDEGTEDCIETPAEPSPPPLPRDSWQDVLVERDLRGCRITVLGDTELAMGDLEDAVRAYLRHFCPALEHIPIEWVENQMCESLAREIAYRLKHASP